MKITIFGSCRQVIEQEFVISKIDKIKNVKLKFENTNKTVRNFITAKKFIWKM